MYNKYIVLIFFFLKITLSKTADLKFGEDISTAHLKNKHVQKVCKNIDAVCDDITDELCAVRLVNDTFEYKEFDNICLLFISNMCVYVGNEYFVIKRGNCKSYLENRPNWIIGKYSESDAERGFNEMRRIENSIIKESRRYDGDKDNINANSTVNEEDGNSNSTVSEEGGNSNSTASEEGGNSNSTVSEEGGNSNSTGDLEYAPAPPMLRDAPTTTPADDDDEEEEDPSRFQGLFNGELQANDGHYCPLGCSDLYAPLCLMINRNYGGDKYIFMTFVNHCQYDIWACKHPDMFTPPPISATTDSGEDPPTNAPDVKPSFMGWSSCASTKYFAFTRFSEAASSMGHFGWLDGVSAHRIIDPQYRKPGYG